MPLLTTSVARAGRWLGSSLIALAVLLLVPAPARAVWSHDVNLGTPVCLAGGDQSNTVGVSDGAGGMIVAWADPRSGGFDIYAQRLNASGVPQWTADGVLLCGAAQTQTYLAITADGSGGAIVVWYDNRALGDDIYAQRISANGTPLWAADGVPVCTAAGYQNGPLIASDGSGGAFITWADDRGGTGYPDVYVQHLASNGTPVWTVNGVVACNATNDQTPMSIIADGAGGAIVAWPDWRSGGTDIYIQRLNAAGAAVWTANGAAMCTATGGQVTPVLVSDGAQGAFVAWEDSRAGNADIYVQHAYGPNGAVFFAANGLAVGSGTGGQSSPCIASDGNGGAVIAWMDTRSGNQDIYAQRVSALGTVAWTANGVAVCSAAGNQYFPQITADGTGGAFLDWEDERIVDDDLYAQHVLSTGSMAWTANGVAVCTGAYSQQQGPIVSDGNGGALIAFPDFRGTSADIYAQRVSRFGQIGMPEPTIASVRDVPNDQGGSTKVSWYASWLDQASDPNLTAYDVYRSAPASLATAAIRSGAQQITRFGEVPAAGSRAFLLPNSTELYAWEFLGTVNAVHFLNAYGFIAPTTGDSIAGSNPLTAFMVVARNASGSMYWLSAPDSGYSVDNISPATPAPFAGEYSDGSTALHWQPNVEADFAHYALYRGTSASFTPGPGNLVASPADTGYVDAAGAPYFYKLAAVDVHGNTSGYATLQPTGTTAVPPLTATGRLALALPAPNPVRVGAAMRFELARAGRASLVLFDQQGRRVRELVDGTFPAGAQTIAWDGRDAAGAPAASGLYFLRLEAEGRTITRRVVVSR